MSANPDFPARQGSPEALALSASGEQATEPTTPPTQPAPLSSARSKAPSASIRQTPTPRAGAPALADPFLYLLAQVLDDLEKTRIANENRLRQLTRSVEDKDGEERGFGLDASNPDVARLTAIVETLDALEHGAELNLKRALRKHPFGRWVKNTIGVGEKQGARLLAAIGDPYWNTLHDRPRTVSELWAYCGLHTLPAGQVVPGIPIEAAGGNQTGHADQSPSDTPSSGVRVAAKHRKNIRSNWSTAAKMRAYLIATSCIKQASSPYRAIYDARRAHTAVTHPEWTAGHSHNDGLRIVSKAILRDLWREARAIHESPAPDAKLGPNPIRNTRRAAGEGGAS